MTAFETSTTTTPPPRPGAGGREKDPARIALMEQARSLPEGAWLRVAYEGPPKPTSLRAMLRDYYLEENEVLRTRIDAEGVLHIRVDPK